MVLKGSVFIVNVLCSLVPCDIKYPYPETFKDPDALKHHFKIEYNGPVTGAHQHNFYAGHPIVWTKLGKMEGYFMKVVGGRKIFAFEGIPYAEPTERFRPPIPKKMWTNLYQANEKGPDCIQYNMLRLNRLFGEEHCLFLNVYTPYIPNQGLNVTNIPVLVWFHDGGFLQGSGSDVGPSYLLQNDVILVTINFRVGVMGVLGFMSTGDSASPGNYGLKDQLLALQWVNQNIEAFSGDPTRVTLIGHGSGGANVHLQMISPRARGLFSSAISLSGTAFNYWSLHSTEEARNLTHYFGKLINCPVHNGSQVLVHCLRQMDALELVQYQIPLLDDWFAPIILFRPTIEDDYQVETAFLTETPEEAYNKGNVANVPYIASFTADEGLTYLLLHAVVGSIKMLRRNWNDLAPDFLDFEQFNVDIEEITRRITWFYLKEVNSEKAPLSTFADMIRDRFILGGLHKALQAHCQIAPTYSYVFAYNGQYNLGNAVGYKSKEWGVGHGEDVYYIVNSTLKYNGFKRRDPELILSKIMVNLISNFAHKGEPIFTTEQGEDIRIWNPITDPKNISMLLIDKVIKMIPQPFMKNIHFWESLGLPDSQPLNFGNANPAIRNFGNGLLNNVVPRPDVGTQIQPPPIFQRKPDDSINTQLSAPAPLDNNALNENYDTKIYDTNNQAQLHPNNDQVNNGNPQYVGERAPDKNNINLLSYDNRNINSVGQGISKNLNENGNSQLNANTEDFQYPDTNAEKPQQIANNIEGTENGNNNGVNYDYNDPNVQSLEKREGNKIGNNNNLENTNTFPNDDTQNPKFNAPQIQINRLAFSGENNNYLNDPNVQVNNGGDAVINTEHNNDNPILVPNSNTEIIPDTNLNVKVPPAENSNDYDSDPNTNVNEEKEENNIENSNTGSIPGQDGDFGDRIISTTEKPAIIQEETAVIPEVNLNSDTDSNNEEEDDKGEEENQVESNVNSNDTDLGEPVATQVNLGQEDSVQEKSANVEINERVLEPNESSNSTAEVEGSSEEYDDDESDIPDNS